MKDLKITCDTCGRDRTYTGNSIDYRLEVASVRLGGNPEHEFAAVTDMAVYPPVDRTYHFCGLSCLRKHPIATGEQSTGKERDS